MILDIKKLLFGVLIICAAALSAPCQASSAENYFKGKTLTIIVTTAPGGGHDWWARALAPYIKRNLDLSGVKVVNIPGGGNVRGDNAIYQAKANGLTIGVIDTGAVFTQMFPADDVHFNVSKYTELGSTDFGPFAFGTQPDGPYKNFKDILQTKRPIIVLATGKAGSSYQIANILLSGFNVPHKMVPGFKGEHQLIATFLTGDGDFFGGAAYHFRSLGSKVDPVIMISNKRFPDLPSVPTLSEEANAAGLSAARKNALESLANLMFTDVLVVGPPGIPPQRVQALEAAVEKSVADPGLKKLARKADHIAQYTSGVKIQKYVEDMLSHEAEFKRLNQ